MNDPYDRNLSDTSTVAAVKLNSGEAKHIAAETGSPETSSVEGIDPDLDDPDYTYDAGIEVTSGELEGCKSQKKSVTSSYRSAVKKERRNALPFFLPLNVRW